MTKYNHAYDIAFEFISEDPEGHISEEQIVLALLAKIMQLSAEGALQEAVGAPFDTYEMEN